MRIGPNHGEGELAHVGLGDDHRSAGAEPPHDCGVLCGGGRFFRQNFGSGTGRLAGDVEQVLHGNDRAVQRTERNAGPSPRVGGIGGRARGIGIHCQARANSFTGWIGDTVQGFLKSVAGR